MKIIELSVLSNGAHRNTESYAWLSPPEGWAMIPEDMEMPASYPFVNVEAEEGGTSAPVDGRENLLHYRRKAAATDWKALCGHHGADALQAVYADDRTATTPHGRFLRGTHGLLEIRRRVESRAEIEIRVGSCQTWFLYDDGVAVIQDHATVVEQPSTLL